MLMNHDAELWDHSTTNLLLKEVNNDACNNGDPEVCEVRLPYKILASLQRGKLLDVRVDDASVVNVWSTDGQKSECSNQEEYLKSRPF